MVIKIWTYFIIEASIYQEDEQQPASFGGPQPSSRRGI